MDFCFSNYIIDRGLWSWTPWSVYSNTKFMTDKEKSTYQGSKSKAFGDLVSLWKRKRYFDLDNAFKDPRIKGNYFIVLIPIIHRDIFSFVRVDFPNERLIYYDPFHDKQYYENDSSRISVLELFTTELVDFMIGSEEFATVKSSKNLAVTLYRQDELKEKYQCHQKKDVAFYHLGYMLSLLQGHSQRPTNDQIENLRNSYAALLVRDKIGFTTEDLVKSKELTKNDSTLDLAGLNMGEYNLDGLLAKDIELKPTITSTMAPEAEVDGLIISVWSDLLNKKLVSEKNIDRMMFLDTDLTLTILEHKFSKNCENQNLLDNELLKQAINRNQECYHSCRICSKIQKRHHERAKNWPSANFSRGA